MKSNTKLELFLTFLKIGAFTFGGGYAMIPLIQKEVTEKKKWLTEDDLMEMVAIAESTPGPIAINAATYVGYRVGGILGAVLSTLGVVIPSFLIITLIAFVFNKYMDNPIVKNAFWGIRIAVLALIIKALITMIKQCPKNYLSYTVAVLALIAVAFFNINALVVIVIAGVSGIIYQGIRRGEKK